MEQMIAISDDPWSWTTEQLVGHLCRSPSLFRAAGQPDSLPDVAALETQLRQRRITGDGFLTALDSNGLRSELRVHSLTERMSLFAVIDFLRDKSDGYKQHVAAALGLTLDTANAPPSVKAKIAPTNTATMHASDRKRQQAVQVDMQAAAGTYSPMVEFGVDGGHPQEYGGGEWGHLSHWQEEGEGDEDPEMAAEGYDQPLDGVVFGDESDDEVHCMGGGAGEQISPNLSDGEDDSNKVQGTSKLSQDQIVDIINERIEYYTNRWQPNSGVPKGEEIHYDRDAMRARAEASDTTQRLIRTYEAEIEYYTHRLDELCEEIFKVPGRSVNHVKTQCRNLEVTINSKLLSEWLLSIYQLEEAECDDEEESQPGSSMAETDPNVVTRDSAATHEVIDLGLPSEASEDELEEMLVDSSPAPELHTRHHEHSSSDRFHTPDSVLGDTDVAPTIEHQQTVSASQMPPKSRTAPRHLPLVDLSDRPEHASINSARRWLWKQLVETMDRKRIVTKALLDMPRNDLETIRERLRVVKNTDMMREIPACVIMLVKQEKKIPGVLQRDMHKIIPFTRLFLCWWLCANHFRHEPSTEALHETHAALMQGKANSGVFCDYVRKVLSTTFTKDAFEHEDQPSQTEIITISDDEEEMTPASKINREIRRRERGGDVVTLD